MISYGQLMCTQRLSFVQAFIGNLAITKHVLDLNNFQSSKEQ